MEHLEVAKSNRKINQEMEPDGRICGINGMPCFSLSIVLYGTDTKYIEGKIT